MMNSPDDRQPGAGDSAINVPKTELRRLSPVVTAYLAMQRALAADDLSRAQAAAVELEKALTIAQIERPPEAQVVWAQITQSLSSHARQVAQANSVEHARMGFEGLSDDVVMILRRLGNPLNRPLMQAHCPMAFGSRGASWLQQGTDIDNAYFGASMRQCGEVKQRVEPGSHLPTPEVSKPPAARGAPAPGHQH